MRLVIETIRGMSAAYIPNSSAVRVDCDMNKSQMFDALLAFLEHITDADWAEWERKINADSQDMVPCRHEWYQGTCAHCAIPAIEYRLGKGLPV